MHYKTAMHLIIKISPYYLLPRDARLSRTAKRGIAIVSRSSICLSITLRYRRHIGWTSSKLITRVISLGSSYLGYGATTSAIYSKRNTPKFGWNRGAVGHRTKGIVHLSQSTCLRLANTAAVTYFQFSISAEFFPLRGRFYQTQNLGLFARLGQIHSDRRSLDKMPRVKPISHLRFDYDTTTIRLRRKTDIFIFCSRRIASTGSRRARYVVVGS